MVLTHSILQKENYAKANIMFSNLHRGLIIYNLFNFNPHE